MDFFPPAIHSEITFLKTMILDFSKIKYEYTLIVIRVVVLFCFVDDLSSHFLHGFQK